MIDKELEKKANESYAKRLKDSSYYETGEEGAYICGYVAGAKEHAPQWHIVADGDFPKEEKEYWCKVFYYESEETFNAFLWFDPSTKEFKFLDNIGEDEVSGFNVKKWCEIPEE